jgi:beta-lactamase regulating signal transducer with metallopeptidase domain
MTTTLAIVLLVKVTVVLSLALAATWGLRRRTAALRHLVLTAAFVAIAIMPFAAAWAPALDVPAPIHLTAVEASRPGEVLFSQPIRPVGTAAIIDRPAPTTRDWYQRVDLNRVLPMLWLFGAALSLVPVLIGVREIRRVRRRARPWSQGSALVQSACRDAGLQRHVQLLLDENGPAAFGIVRPVVLLPREARGWSRSEVQCAVIHELEHVRRHDCLVQLIARLVCAFYWWHPLVWVAWRHVQLEAERACDDAVVRVSEAIGYADQLVSLAERVTRAPKPLVAMATRNDLARRVESVLADDLPRDRARARLVCGVGFCTAFLVAIVAPLRAVKPGAPTLPSLPTVAAALVQPTVPPAGMVAPLAPAGSPADQRRESTDGLVTDASRLVASAEMSAPQLDVANARTAHADEPRGPAVIAAAGDLSMTAVPVASPEALQSPDAFRITGGGDTTPNAAPGTVGLEQQLQDAFKSDREFAELSLSVDTAYRQLNRAEYAVSITVRIAPASELAVRRSERSRFDFIGSIVDPMGYTFLRLRDSAELTLDPSLIPALARTPIVYSTIVTMLPGRYTLKILARDETTERIGSAIVSFTIPNLAKLQGQ